jgi:hypothetical protein
VIEVGVDVLEIYAVKKFAFFIDSRNQNYEKPIKI